MEAHKNNHPSVGFLVGKDISLYPLNPTHKDIYFQWSNSEKVRLYLGNSVPVPMSEIEKMLVNPSQDKIYFEIQQNNDNNPIGIAKITGIHWIRRKCSIGALIGEE
ncbi:MAG: GNAT family N-acetyltransferase, partial [Promethearchaeota archaeon]